MVVIIHSGKRKIKVNLFKFVISFAIIFSFIFGAISIVNNSALSANEHNEIIVVRPGDSLWTISAEIGRGQQSTRTIVNEIISLNNLDSVTLYVGQQLEVPSKYFLN